MLAVMNQFTGINGVMYYAYDILHDVGVPNVGCLFHLVLSDDLLLLQHSYYHYHIALSAINTSSHHHIITSSHNIIT